MNIERGDFGFSDYVGPGFFNFVAKCIRFFTKSRWSHTYVIPLEDDVVGHIVEEAGPMGVVCCSIDKYEDKTEYIAEFWRPMVTSEDQVDIAIRRIWKMMGKSYGYTQLLGFILVWVWYKITRRKANNPIRGGIICSELVLEYLKALFPNEECFKRMNRDTTSPQDIYKVILDRADLFVRVDLTDQGAV